MPCSFNVSPCNSRTSFAILFNVSRANGAVGAEEDELINMGAIDV
jgi:hypothetical protein